MTTADVESVKEELAMKFPGHDPLEGPWIAAISRLAWKHNVNPGGQMACWRLDELPGFEEQATKYPRLKLMSKADIEAIDGEPAMSMKDLES